MSKGKTANQEYQVGQVYSFSPDELKPNPDQPRKHFDEDALTGLKDSIEIYGLLQPVLFKLNENGEKILVAGERRLRAIKMLDTNVIQARLVDGDTQEIALVENVVREDLNIIEKAECLQVLKDTLGYDTIKLGKVIGKKHNTVSEILGLNRLADEIKAKCRETNIYALRQLKKISHLEHKDQKARFNVLEAQMKKAENAPDDQKKADRLKKVASFQNKIVKLKTTFNKIKKWDKNDKAVMKEELTGFRQYIEELLAELGEKPDVPAENQAEEKKSDGS